MFDYIFLIALFITIIQQFLVGILSFFIFYTADVNSTEFLKKNYTFLQGWRNKINESRIDL